jgi:competence protein ComEC
MAPRFVWAVVLGFLAGVFVSSPTPLGYAHAVWLSLLGGALAMLGLFEREKLPPFFVLATFLLASAGGIARMHGAMLAEHPELARFLGKQVAVEGVLVDAPDARESSTRLSIEVRRVAFRGESLDIRTGVLAIAPPHVAARYGDIVHATGTLRAPKAFETGEGREFDYPGYLAKDGILYELAFAEVEQTGANRGNPFKAGVLAFKERYLAGLGAVLPEPAGGLAGGITIGDKRSIGPELSEIFRNVGLIHIIVLSGYNITIVINGLARFFWWTPRIFQLGLAGLIALFFVVISGGAASAARAGAMAVIAVFARMTGRLYLAARVLGVVAVTMVLWNPLLLAFDPGFQLSMLATLGLIFFTPLFEERLAWVTGKFHLREILASTLGTQLAVLPLLLYQNGLFPVFSLPANLLALVAVPLAMLLSFVSALGGMLLGPLALPLALPANALLSYIVKVAEFFNALPFSSVSIPTFPAWLMFALYAVLIAGVVYLKKKERRA